MVSLKFTLLLVAYSLLPLIFQTNPIHALHIGIQASGFPLVSKTCSRKCESEFCSLPTPFLRYGKYCGILYSGCPGEKPCDDLDACCMKHDSCIEAKNNDYLNRQCTQGLISCIKRFKKSKRLTFKGNTCDVDEVADLVTALMETALLAGRFLRIILKESICFPCKLEDDIGDKSVFVFQSLPEEQKRALIEKIGRQQSGQD